MTTTIGGCPRCGTPPARESARFCRACGAPLAGTPDPAPPIEAPAAVVAGPDPVAAALAPARAWWHRRPGGRTAWLAGGVAVLIVLALIGYLAIVAVNDHRYPPEQPVRDLFAALAARDTAAAAELAGCASPACRGGVLASGYAPPEAVVIGEPVYGDPADDTRRPDKNIASVPVTYRLSGTEHKTTLRVQRAGDGLARPFRILSGGTGRLAIGGAHVDQVQIGAVAVPAGDPDGPGLTVLPGTYQVQVAAADPLFAPAAANPATVDVTTTTDPRTAPARLALTVQIRPDAIAQVNEQIRAFLDDCTRQPELRPRGCPFHVPGIVIGAADVRWTGLQPPTVEIVPTGDPGLTDAPATARTVTPGRVTVTYSAITSADGKRTTTTRQLPVEIEGTVKENPDLHGTVVWVP